MGIFRIWEEKPEEKYARNWVYFELYFFLPCPVERYPSLGLHFIWIYMERERKGLDHLGADWTEFLRTRL